MDRESVKAIHNNVYLPVSGCKESQFYSLPFGQALATTPDKTVETIPSIF